MTTTFRDRADAGRRLAERLGRYADDPGLLVLGLPRGGVPVAAEVAAALHAPLDVYVVRKLGVPGHRELAMGAIASGGVRVVNERVVSATSLSDEVIEEVAREEERELERRERLLRGERPPPEVAGRTVILVDDGIATGSTMRAAIAALRTLGAARIVVGVPVAAPDTCLELEREVDEVVCVATPEPFMAISLWYEDFDQTTDGEVRDIIDRSSARPPDGEHRDGKADPGS
jgi:putative phosphoribosyl transferase